MNLNIELLDDLRAEIMATPYESKGLASLGNFIVEKLTEIIEPEVEEIENSVDPDFKGCYYEYYGVRREDFY